MRTGETLIKLAKHKVEAVQKLISAAERTRADLNARLDDLAAMDARERALADADPATSQTYLSFVATVRVQEANLRASLDGVERQLDALREDLQAGYEELKKFEQLEERRLAREAEARAKRLAAFMDESALMRAARA
jgi:flagellar protein FliJ